MCCPNQARAGNHGQRTHYMCLFWTKCEFLIILKPSFHHKSTKRRFQTYLDRRVLLTIKLRPIKSTVNLPLKKLLSYLYFSYKTPSFFPNGCCSLLQRLKLKKPAKYDGQVLIHPLHAMDYSLTCTYVCLTIFGGATCMNTAADIT